MRLSDAVMRAVNKQPEDRFASAAAFSAELERALADDLRGAQPRDLAYRIAGSLAVDAPQQQALLELETTSARLAEETRILNRETELLRDLLVRLRERGERPELN